MSGKLEPALSLQATIDRRGCMYRCLDPECNEGTFDINATSCFHCGGTRLSLEHPGSIFRAVLQAFVCDCGGLDAKANASLPRFRRMARDGSLERLAPGSASLFGLKDH